MESSTDGRYRVVTRRRMPAPREIVFDAWIDPKGIHEWMCPGDALEGMSAERDCRHQVWSTRY